MTRQKQITYILIGVVVVGAIMTLFPRLFEGFRMSEYATCPECQDDSDCVKCGFKNASCDKSAKKGGLGTCIPRGMSA